VLDSEPPSVDRVAVAEAKCELSILFTARFEATAELVPRDAAYSELPWPSSRVDGFVAARAVPALRFELEVPERAYPFDEPVPPLRAEYGVPKRTLAGGGTARFAEL
jgi:hypothetical protein